MNRPVINSKKQKKVRQQLRNEPTPWEHILWQSLKGKQLGGYKFRRQHGIENYIVDFFCPIVKLIVELDGGGHYDKSQKEKDIRRDEVLTNWGYTIIRIRNNEIDQNLEGVLEYILESCKNEKEKLGEN